ncbi:thiol-disulfide isomerase/thioredoxin [Chitinophaga dinghuensis]|uniref:Thiol-disulfide isomerase/thioredoxin n=1 Tax=Chitinophaga dinghuensis TaxID=1539050 RepID=A0A327W8G5_9BACT|nr:TlpA disulfide reductase family protein [Chitinophaga dinghuensis]RAJ85532.1 thiol-disulfide isomerase/thioredoxin [Chitinophaga dinghuensis]
MKRLTSSMLPVALCMAFTTARAAAGPGPVSPITIIQGTTANEKATKISLMAVEEGVTKEIATSEVNADHAFAFALTKPVEGFYYLTYAPKDLGTRIYVKAGDQLKLKLEGNSFDQQAGSAENKLLQQWDKVASPVTGPPSRFDSTTFYSYFPTLEATMPKIQAFKKQFASPNKNFSNLMKQAMDVDVEYAAMRFLLIPHSVHPKKEQYPAYYNTIIKDQKLCDDNAMKLGNVSAYISMYSTFRHLMNSEAMGKMDAKDRFAQGLNGFCNEHVKALYITNSLGAYKTFDGLIEAITPYQKYLVTDLEKKRYLDYEKSVRKFAAGEAGFNFSGETPEGKQVSFNDLKGKVVVVDVWATWCGPCKAELPFLQKLEEEMEGKAVTFVGCSVDEAKDKEKWKQFVKEKEMKGVQMFVNGWSEVTKFYGITGIPRFMVFDKEGKIVTIDAPRPSTPELKALLEKLLAKG